MKIGLSSTSLALAISAKPVLGRKQKSFDAADHVADQANRVNSSYQNDGTPAAQRRAEQSSSQSVINPNGVAGKKLGAADIGIFSGTDVAIGRRNRNGNGLFGGKHRRRFLQEDGDETTTEEETTCAKPDTCEPNLCDCVAAGGQAFQCSTELNAVCNGVTGEDGTEFTIEGCVNWPDYYRNFYCPFAKCIVEEGRTLGSCGCDFYAKSYATYKDNPEYADDEETLQHFAAHACCQSKDADDDDGMLSCFEEAPTSMPSNAPSAPTTSPTVSPTGNPTLTASPTISPNPTSSPTTASPTKKSEVEEIDESSPTPPVEAPTDSPPDSESATPPAPSTSSAENSMRWGLAGTAMPFVVATIAWSFLG